jgi:hypothetical protein
LPLGTAAAAKVMVVGKNTEQKQPSNNPTKILFGFIKLFYRKVEQH